MFFVYPPPQILAHEKPYFNHGVQIMPPPTLLLDPLPKKFSDLVDLTRKAGQQNSTWNFQRCTKEVDAYVALIYLHLSLPTSSF